MATALIAWFRAPAPTTWTSTAPCDRTTPAMAPATEFGFDLVETLSCSMSAAPQEARFPSAAYFDACRERSSRRAAARRQGLGSVVERDGCVEVDVEVVLDRSEEHTSELQSLMRLSYAVFCLKKKNIK